MEVPLHSKRGQDFNNLNRGVLVAPCAFMDFKDGGFHGRGLIGFFNYDLLCSLGHLDVHSSLSIDLACKEFRKEDLE